jgi:hypothetical protein
MLRRVVDEQVYVFGLTVPLDELRLEVSANFLEHDFEPLDSACVKYLLLYLVTNTMSRGDGTEPLYRVRPRRAFWSCRADFPEDCYALDIRLKGHSPRQSVNAPKGHG